ncbi:MAG: hypothetical protein JXA64_06305 [Candidatus Fermentibacteraceae bacterium]|nr:hypothetical protein [Candidatus Fermentibacteraceae bacterium]MBN2608708.1 hypothetical protein [Candidatus Fermentibacteraceae bacterium]
MSHSLYVHVKRLVEAAGDDPGNGTLKKQFERYLIIRRSKKREGGYTVSDTQWAALTSHRSGLRGKHRTAGSCGSYPGERTFDQTLTAAPASGIRPAMDMVL